MAMAIVALAFAACGSKNTPEAATETMIKNLQKGDYAALVDQINFTKEISDDEKAGLVGMAQAKLGPDIEKKGGIQSYEVGKAEIAEDGQSAVVPYTVTFGEGKAEEDKQKLVLVDGKWMLDEGK